MADAWQQLAQLDAALLGMVRKDVPAATVSALNKTAALAKTRLVKGLSKQTRVQQKLIRRRTFVKRANRRTLKVSLKAYTRGISPLDMGAKDTGKGGWKTRRGRGVRARGGFQFQKAFIANGPNGKPQVFERNGQSTGHYDHVDVVRVEIARPAEAIAQTVAKRVMRQRYEQLFSHEINRRLKSKGLV